MLSDLEILGRYKLDTRIVERYSSSLSPLVIMEALHRLSKTSSGMMDWRVCLAVR